uniref:Peptidase M13 C-terminal domain-containing protein n=1 Tax=Ciona savignyi TaxID=51511 RepID=H2Z904_CIOSA
LCLVHAAAFYQRNIDPDVDPCDDFFEFACGRWISENPIPDHETKREIYSVLTENVINHVREILEDEEYNETDNTALYNARNYYKSCVDISIIEELGTKPLLELLVGNLSWPVISKQWHDDDYDEIGTLSTLQGEYNNKILVMFYVGTDEDNTTSFVLKLDQASLAIRDVYYKDDVKYSKIQNALRTLMINLATLVAEKSGIDIHPDNITRDMTDAFNFEMEVAKIKVSGSSSNPNSSYNVLSLLELNSEIPGFDWVRLGTEIIRDVNFTPNQTLIVGNRQYLQDLVELLRNTSSRVKQNYMVWRIVKHRAMNMGVDFQNLHLKFSTVYTGQLKMRDRRYTCVQSVDRIFSGPIGYMFIKKYFKEENKKTASAFKRANYVLDMADGLKKAFKWLLDNEVTWMDAESKALAREKCDFIKPNIGYSEYFTNKTVIALDKMTEMDPTNYFENVLNYLRFVAQLSWVIIGDSVDKSTWNTPPTTVNAYYSPMLNAIMFPAGELQAPFFWGNAYPMSVQFGAIGSIIGHELTHAFDIYGQKYDKFGNRANLWSNHSLAAFYNKTECLIDQYNNYYWTTAESYLDGDNTLSENIADNGGIRQSFHAYKQWVEDFGEEQKLPGMSYTSEQLFFIGYANVRCGHYKPELAEFAINSDVHSPGKFRILGSLSNFEEFSNAFSCPVGSNMNRGENRCIVW